MPVPVNGGAAASTVLGVVGLAIPFVCSIAAIVLAVRARRSLRADPGVGGKRLSLIGLWLGIVGLGTWTALAVGMAAR